MDLITDPTFNNIVDEIGNGNLGCLIWKARDSYKNNWVLTQDTIELLGPGCFTDQYTTDEITQNLEIITKEFGSNKQ